MTKTDRVIFFIVVVFVVSSAAIVINMDISGNAAYTPEQPARIFAHLDAPATTTVTTANDYYLIQGTLITDTFDGWSVTSPNCYGYDLNKTRKFFVAWAAALSIDQPLSTVHIAVRVNGIVREAQRMGTQCFTANQAYALAGGDAFSVQQGDDVDLVVTTSRNGDKVTFNHLTIFVGRIDP